MKKRRIQLESLFITIMTIVMMVSPGYAAGPADGARCPGGYTANFSNGVLRCSKTRTEFAEVACPPPTHLLNTERVIKPGRDRCKVPFTPVPSDESQLPGVVCLAVPGTTGWTLQQDVVGNNDRCRRQVTQFACPACSSF